MIPKFEVDRNKEPNNERFRFCDYVQKYFVINETTVWQMINQAEKEFISSPFFGRKTAKAIRNNAFNTIEFCNTWLHEPRLIPSPENIASYLPSRLFFGTLTKR